MGLFTKDTKPLISFVSTIEGLADIPELRPQPSSKFIPEWWKSVPTTNSNDFFRTQTTVKSCPMFPDYFSQGYVIPMWADSVLKYNEETDSWVWKAGRSPSQSFWDAHGKDQFVSYVTPNVQGSDSNMVFKANCPWKIITPKGYSVFQLPMWYHFNHEFSVMPGIIHTDFHHDINQQVLYFGKGKEVFIPKGTPFVQYIPFKRDKPKYNVRDVNKKDKKTLNSYNVNLEHSLVGLSSYKSLRKKFVK